MSEPGNAREPDPSGDRRLELADGRTLGFREFGVRDGLPLIYCHGFPSSRREAGMAEQTARALGLRVIAPDRPGFGLSSALPGRRIGQWPRDLAALADALGITRFAVLGVSGGGPYALACAAILPERVRGIGVVCGMGPPAVFADTLDQCSRVARLTYGAACRAPRVSRLLCATLAAGLRRWPGPMLTALTRSAPISDRIALAQAQTAPTLAASMAESIRRGSGGAWWELQLFAQPWDFDLAGIGVPVRLWHGEADTVVPVASGRHLAAALPRCEATFLAGEGHYSLPVNHQRAILAELAARR